MDLRKIKALIEAVTEGDIAELEVESKEGTVRIKRKPTGADTAPPYLVMSAATLPAHEPNAIPPPAVSAAGESPAREPVSTPEPEDETVMVTAPIVGTFYESSSPGAPPFVEVGDRVDSGQVLCIIEAMKLMNEIEAETAGVIVKRFVSNGQPVEYGEALFSLQPDN